MDLTQLITNPNEITFALLFVVLLGYVIKTNGDRENKYLDTIATLTTSLELLKDLKDSVDEIKQKVG